MTPLQTRPAVDGDRVYLQVGSFAQAFLTEHTLQRIEALWRDLKVPIELVPVLERREVSREASGAEVSEE
jgi:hypothetical protein